MLPLTGILAAKQTIGNKTPLLLRHVRRITLANLSHSFVLNSKNSTQRT